jgi:hypothetical protein
MKWLVIFTLIMSGCTNGTHEGGDAAKTGEIASNSQKEYSRNRSNMETDLVKAQKSKAIVLAELIDPGDGNKYLYPIIRINKVIKNDLGYSFPDTLKVAHYNWKNGVPKGKECLIYLTPWPYGSDELSEDNQWMLLEADGDYACECNDEK